MEDPATADLKTLLEIGWKHFVSLNCFLLRFSLPKLPPIRVAQEPALQDRGSFKEALNAYNIAVEKNPDNPHCYHLRGQCFLMQGQYDLAMREFSAAVKINPQCAGAPADMALHPCRTRATLAAGRFSGAIRFPRSATLTGVLLLRLLCRPSLWQGTTTDGAIAFATGDS